MLGIVDVPGGRVRPIVAASLRDAPDELCKHAPIRFAQRSGYRIGRICRFYF
jgi:hypothetical protein